MRIKQADWSVLLIFFVLLSLTRVVSAQNFRVDSIKSLLDSELNPSKRVDVLNDLSYESFDRDDSSALYYAKISLLQATQINYVSGIKYAHCLTGIGYSSQGDYTEAHRHFRKCQSLKVTGSERIEGLCLLQIGNAFRDQAYFDSARYYYDLAEKTFKKSDNKSMLAAVYKNQAYLNIIQWNNDEAFFLLSKAKKLVYESKSKYGLISLWSLYGTLYENLLNFDSTDFYFEKMCESANRNDTFFQIKCNLNRAELFFRRGEFSQSLQSSFKALKLSEHYNYPPQKVAIFEKIGDVYLEFSQFELCSQYLFRALKISERFGLRYEIGRICSELAWVNKEQGNFTLALEYINRSEQVRQAIQDKHGVSNCNNIRGLIHYQTKKYDLAITELQKAIVIRKEIGHREGVSSSLFNLSLIYEDLNQLDKSYDLQKQAIAIEETIDNKQSVAISYNSIAGTLIKQKRFNEAEDYLQKVVIISKETNSKILLRNNYGFYAQLYNARGDYKNAFDYQFRYQQLNDSIYSEGGSVKLAEMQALYQVEQKESEIALLNKDKKLKENQLKLQKADIELQQSVLIFVMVLLLLTILIIITFIRYNRRIRKANYEIVEQKEEIMAQSEELIEANQTIAKINRNLEGKIEERTLDLKQAYKELDTFFYRSSHDFRRPITTFLGLAEVAKITVTDENALNLFDKVKETANNLDKMLVKLQSISDVGANQLVFKQVFIKEVFENVCQGFREEILRKNIKILHEVEANENFSSYPAMVKTIVENLIENSIQFCGVVNPYIKLKAYHTSGESIIEIYDNGQGIEDEYKDRIFEMYFRGNERSKGNGLGLYIVKKAVDKLSGELDFESRWGRGSMFRVRFLRDV